MKSQFFLICFCGPDGSGKSTLVNELSEIFEALGEEVNSIHAHGYSATHNSFGQSAESVRKFRYFYRFLIPLAYADNLMTYFSKYRRSLRKSHTILDRYFYDKFCRLWFYGISTKLLTQIFVRALPKPDLVIFLLPPPEVCFERKAEFTIEEYKKFDHIYKSVSQVINALQIDTSQPREQNLEKLRNGVASLIS